jgi:hypothetical protein
LIRLLTICTRKAIHILSGSNIIMLVKNVFNLVLDTVHNQSLGYVPKKNDAQILITTSINWYDILDNTTLCKINTKLFCYY